METKLTPIKRYRITKVVKGYPKPEPHPLGAWVKYEDVSQLLQQRDELMEALKELCEAHGGDMTTWLKAYDKAMKTISNIQKHQI